MGTLLCHCLWCYSYFGQVISHRRDSLVQKLRRRTRSSKNDGGVLEKRCNAPGKVTNSGEPLRVIFLNGHSARDIWPAHEDGGRVFGFNIEHDPTKSLACAQTNLAQAPDGCFCFSSDGSSSLNEISTTAAIRGGWNSFSSCGMSSKRATPKLTCCASTRRPYAGLRLSLRIFYSFVLRST